METPRNTPDIASLTPEASDSDAGVGSLRNMFDARHQLVEAQVEVLKIYLEKRTGEHLLEALDRLIESARVSFREEEALMERLTAVPDLHHREMHSAVLAQLETLRRCAMDFDRSRLLAQLIQIDRQLISHISAATQPSPNSGAGAGAPDSLGARVSH